MSLGSPKRLLITRHNTTRAYPSILTTHIPRALERVMMAVGDNGAGAHKVAPEAGNRGTDACDIRMSGESDFIRVHCELLLGADSQRRPPLRLQNTR